MTGLPYSVYKLRVDFTTSVLGTQPQKAVATEYITSKVAARVTEPMGEDTPANGFVALDEETGLPADELETLPEMLDKGTTAFHKKDGKPIFYDYMIKGFLKDAGQVFNGHRGVKNLRSKIDNFVFPFPRQIELHLPEGAEITFCERPLRAMTAQGPRTSLARSEEIPEGTWFECQLKVYGGVISEPLLNDLLSYGGDKGIGQWRNGGHGRFSFTLEKVE